jgi:hypothetical protein
MRALVDPTETLREEIRQEIETFQNLQNPLSTLKLVHLHFPEHEGGRRNGNLIRSLAIEELTRVNPAIGATFSAASLGAGLVLEGGAKAQREYWLPRLGDGSEIMTICMTEPTSGSHLLGMKTTATPVKGGWIVNGTKHFIGNSHIATAHGVIARTSCEANRNALTAMIISADTPGVSLGKEHNLSGLKGFSLGEIRFTDCFVPKSNQVGSIGDGLRLAHQVVTRHGKPNIGSLAIGLHVRTLDRLINYTTTRELYGAPIAELPPVDRTIATCFSDLYTSRILMYNAVSALDNGHTNTVGISVAKLKASSSTITAALSATTAMGAIGNHPELGAIQLLSDALMTSAPSGTDDVILKRLSEHVKANTKNY